ncbi:EpsG family protein [Lacticaseibacillus paracasei]|uniref:EpsG family protein n=1 Tax=Lacticaseibacillus paracasei TaxID=1597 RepID=UPI0031F4D19D
MKELIYIGSLAVIYALGRLLHTKKDRVSAFIACLILILMMGGQTNNPDYMIYRNIFVGPFYSKDPGFGLILQFLKIIGFNADNFRLGIAIIGLCLISVTVFRLVNTRFLFYLIYGIYPFLFDVVQARNFLVMALLVFGIPFLVDQSTRGKLIFTALIIFAFFIQKVAIVYLPLVFLESNIIQIKRKYFFRAVIVVALLVAVNKGILMQLINHLASSSNQVSDLSNYATINTRYGWIVFWAEQILAYLIVNYANSIEEHFYVEVADANNFSTKDQLKSRFVAFMLNVNVYSFIFLPLFILDENYTRIIRNILPLNLIAVLIVVSAHTSKIYLTRKRLILITCQLAYSVGLFYLMSKSYWDSIIVTTFEQNRLW